MIKKLDFLISREDFFLRTVKDGGSAVLDFKIFDAMYIVAIITYLIRYKMMKNI